MSGRKSGLGRGLGDLLADNAPELRGGATVVWRDESGEVTVTPDANDAKSGKAETSAAVKLTNAPVGGVNTADIRREAYTEAKTDAEATVNAEVTPNARAEIKADVKTEEKREETAGRYDAVSDTPVVIIPPSAPASEENEPFYAKNVEKTDVYDQTKSDDAPVVHHNRSLKALFKSYK